MTSKRFYAKLFRQFVFLKLQALQAVGRSVVEKSLGCSAYHKKNEEYLGDLFWVVKNIAIKDLTNEYIVITVKDRFQSRQDIKLERHIIQMTDRGFASMVRSRIRQHKEYLAETERLGVLGQIKRLDQQIADCEQKREQLVELLEKARIENTAKYELKTKPINNSMS